MMRKSKLTALLLALVLILSTGIGAWAEDGGIAIEDMTAASYANMRANILDYEYWVSRLEGKTVAERYATLVEWHDGLFGPAFYAPFINHYKTHHPDGDLICTCAAPLPYGAEGHTEDCPWRPVEGNELVNEENGITVVGDIPAGVELAVKTAELSEIAQYEPEVEGVKTAYKAFDISMMLDNAEWQLSDGDSVSLSLDVADIGAEGEDMLVYHVHVDGDGTSETELLGPYTVNDGKIIFEMNKFSYVLVLNSTLKIENVEVFYPVSNYIENGDFPLSTNGNWCIIGVYYDESNKGHVLIGQIANNIGRDKVDYVMVNGQEIDNTTTNIVIHDNGENITEIKNGATGDEFVSFSSLPKNKLTAIWDVNCNTIPLSQTFKLGLESDAGGFDIPETGYSLHLEYGLEKTVAVGTSAASQFEDSVNVDRGEWVIYKIEVKNTGTMPLSGMTVTDLLPEDVFDMNTVQMSIDGENGAIGNWQAFSSTLFEDYTSAGGFSRQLYIKAQVLSDIVITTNTTYTNTASIAGENMPTVEDSADIVVNAPKYGTLVVSKAVTSENPNDPAPADAEFTFEISSNATVATFSYVVDNVTKSVANGGTFTLKNGQSASFNEFPNGDFTVEEINNTGYATKVNGVTGSKYAGTMTSAASPVVAFENQFSMRVSALAIAKTVVGNDAPDDTFEFTLALEGTELAESYSYTIGEETKTWTAKNPTIELKANQTATISGLPVGVKYTVTETAKDGYTTKVGDTETNTAFGTISVTQATVTFTNTYQYGKLTIAKSFADGSSPAAGETFVFDVKDSSGKVVAKAVLTGAGSVTIHNLPLGTYTVSEDDAWSWRYTTSPSSDTASVTPDGNPTVTFTNTRSNDKWLDDSAYADNNFDGNLND